MLSHCPGNSLWSNSRRRRKLAFMPQEVQNWMNALWRFLVSTWGSADAEQMIPATDAIPSIMNAVLPMVKGRGRECLIVIML
mmetsp:Transcript_28931/g.53427  ORF Transcript_28931/g.53427 Transcript_28931/m.53427 type:complete len:82 (-) Transcript_28931:41-286(-)